METFAQSIYQFIACLKTHKENYDSAEIKNILQMLHNLLINLLKNRREDREEITKAMEQVEQAIIDVELGKFWTDESDKTIEFSELNISDDNPLKPFIEKCLKVA